MDQALTVLELLRQWIKHQGIYHAEVDPLQSMYNIHQAPDCCPDPDPDPDPDPNPGFDPGFGDYSPHLLSTSKQVYCGPMLPHTINGQNLELTGTAPNI